MTVLVHDLLKRDYFKSAKVLAGHQGLHREVRWVHIVEIARFGHLLNGKEVILTTGLGWADDVEKSISYLQQLLDYGASALCIELVFHVQQLPKKMLQLAEEHHFPIIAFTEEVRFIDITQDIHELIIGQHEKVWWKLEAFHKKLNASLTTNGNPADFIRLLHKETRLPIALAYEGQFRFFPQLRREKKELLIKQLKVNSPDYVQQSIQLLGEEIGCLYYLEDPELISSFDHLALNRCKEILEQFFWKHHYEREINRINQNEWIFHAINGRLTEEEIQQFIHKHFPERDFCNYMVAILPYEQSLLRLDQVGLSESSLVMLLSPIFKRFNFKLLLAKDDSRQLFLLLILNYQKEDLFERLGQTIDQLRKSIKDPLLFQSIQRISFGRAVSDYHNLGKSYETALTTLHYQQNIGQLEKPFYQQLGVYRLIDRIGNEAEIKQIIEDYLAPLMAHDKQHRTELLKTLETFLRHHGSRKETAEELNIVRQTLYYRLQRIETLIGDHFMEPENRLMTEFALYALKYIQY